VLKLIQKMENTQKRRESRTSLKKDTPGKKEEIVPNELPEEAAKENPKETAAPPKAKPHRAPMKSYSSKRKGYVQTNVV